MTEFNDSTPAAYWAARHLQDAQVLRDQAMAQLPGLVGQVQSLLASIGQQPVVARKRG